MLMILEMTAGGCAGLVAGALLAVFTYPLADRSCTSSVWERLREPLSLR